VAIVLTVSLLIVTVTAASALAYTFSHRAFRRNLSELEDKTTRQLNMLSDAVKNLEAEIAQLRKSVPAEFAAAVAPVSSPPTLAATADEAQEITPDTLVVLAAAVTAFLGKKVRIRSAKMLQSPYEIVNPWAQQGRAIVQASHNLPKS
jgi:methylmalonyl-CoA carboxyltransferase 12S subunit